MAVEGGAKTRGSGSSSVSPTPPLEPRTATTSTMSGKNKALVGDELWKRSDHISSELFALTYGTLVVQLIKDYEDYDEVNTQLEKM